MKKWLTVCAIVVAISCSEQEKKEVVYIDGTAPGVYNGMRVYYKKLGPQNKPVNIDTAVVMNERFKFDFQPSESSEDLRFLTVDGVDGSLLFLSQPDGLKISIDKDTIFNSKVEGGPANAALFDYQTSQASYQKKALGFNAGRKKALQSGNAQGANQFMNQWKDEEQAYVEKTTDIINANSDNILGPMILGELMTAKVIKEEKARSIFSKFSEKIKQHELSMRIDNFLKQTEVVAIGKVAPKFEGSNPEGKLVALDDVLGKVTLIDFWASWCRPCRMENPNVVAAYEKYHDKGFNIISVSLDRKNGKEAWKKAIIDDKMDWNHISRLQYFGPIAKQYNVSSIPSTFLLDENGVIIDKNLRGKALHDRLAELL
ncbi:MAG: TlpA disulfide reductase family protein [Nonlabens sp.]